MLFEQLLGPSAQSQIHWCPLTEPPVWPIPCSPQLIVVALPTRARAAVLPAMGTKSREVIWGSQIRGAKMTAEKHFLVARVDQSYGPSLGD